MNGLLYLAAGTALVVTVGGIVGRRGRCVRGGAPIVLVAVVLWPIIVVPIIALALLAGLVLGRHIAADRSTIIDLLVDGPIGRLTTRPIV